METSTICPVCQSPENAVAHRNLRDHLFAAPGVWTMMKCRDCGVCYLNPRPTPRSIKNAYSRYYTHDIPSKIPKIPGTAAWVKSACQNDFLHKHLGLMHSPRIPGGRWLLAWNTGLCRNLLYDHRHLSRPSPGARLLNLGCGNGDFLGTATLDGWSADGLEPDAKAVQAATDRGYSVRQGGLPDTGLSAHAYDAVTMSHVIEHLHDPVSALKEIFRILKPGGTLWIASPNAESPASRFFHDNWRGLEPPRHLVVFTHCSLHRALLNAGFVDIRFQYPRLCAEWYCKASLQLRHPGTTGLPPALRLWVWWVNLAARFSKSHGEELCVLAHKPVTENRMTTVLTPGDAANRREEPDKY